MATKVFTFQARALDGLTNESGALTYVVRKGTTTPIVAYMDSGLSVPATNPQVANALGLVGPLYWNDSVEAEVTFRVKTNDAATVLLQVDYAGGTFSASYIQVGQLTKFNATYTADGAQTKALTGKVVSSPYALNVYFDGIIQPKDNYTVTTDGTDSTITWATTCQPSSGVIVYYEAAVLEALSPAVTDYSGVDISAASVTPTGGSADTLADHLAAKLTSSGGDGSEVVVTPDGATVGRDLKDWTGDVFNVKAGWGGAAAVGDGATDDAAAINRAITACNAAGGGIVEIPKGTYILETVGSSQTIVMMSNVWLRGAGQGVTILKIKNGAESHGPNCQGLSNFRITDLSVDGNRANNVNTSCHGIRIGGTGLTNNNGYLARLEIYNACHYNIGIQGGTNKHIIIQDIELYGSGADGLDVKNIEDNNEDIFISNIRVRTWAQAAGTAQAAIDLRGTVHLSGVRIQDPTQDDAVGIRFREGELLDVNGLGAHRSTLTGFYVDMLTKTGAQGIYVAARDVTVSNGYVRGGQDGVAILDSTFRGASITVEACSDDGFYLQAAGSGLDGDGAILTGCAARSCTDNGFRIDTDNVQLIGCEGTGNDEGVLIAAGADSTRIIGGRYSGNSTSQVTDGGTNTRIRDAIGVDDKLPNQWRLIAQSAVAVSLTGTVSKTALATVSVPAGAMGPNGRIRVRCQYTVTASTNAKTASWDFGGTNFFTRAESGATIVQIIDWRDVCNRNSASSQGGVRASTVPSIGTGLTGPGTGAVNTANAQDLILYGQLANTGETITLENYFVEVMYGA